MKIEIKAKWIEALRSGEYEQTVGALKSYQVNQDGIEKCAYCCLGVLVEAVAPDKFEKDEISFMYQVDGESGVLLDNYMETFGLTRDIASELIGMNDREGKTFHEIADFIQEKL